MPAVGIADTGNLVGALEYSRACAGKRVEPIIGCQISLTRTDNPRLPPDPLVLLARDQTGFANLQHLSSLGFLETDPGLKPQLTVERLAEYAARLFLLPRGTPPASPWSPPMSASLPSPRCMKRMTRCSASPRAAYCPSVIAAA